MGFFSFCTVDTEKSIPCIYEDYKGAPNKVYVLLPKGGYIAETDYNGYGDFGGHDIFDLVVDWNRKFLTKGLLNPPKRDDYAEEHYYNSAVERYKKNVHLLTDVVNEVDLKDSQYMVDTYGPYWKRHLGIALACYDEDHVKLPFPIKIVEQTPLKLFSYYDYNGFSPSCPFQGYFYPDEQEYIEKAVQRSFYNAEKAMTSYHNEQIYTLCEFFKASKLDYMTVNYKDCQLVVKDEMGNTWKDSKVYEFVLNECLSWDKNGSLASGYGAISEDLAERLKTHGATYRVLAEGRKPPVLDTVIDAANKTKEAQNEVEPITKGSINQER